MYSLRTGKSAYEHMYGKSHFERIGEDPELAEHFNAAMVEFSGRVAGTFAAVYDFTEARTVADVGGGNRAILLAALQAPPPVPAILFALPQLFPGAPDHLAAVGASPPPPPPRRTLF